MEQLNYVLATMDWICICISDQLCSFSLSVRHSGHPHHVVAELEGMYLGLPGGRETGHVALSLRFMRVRYVENVWLYRCRIITPKRGQSLSIAYERSSQTQRVLRAVPVEPPQALQEVMTEAAEYIIDLSRVVGLLELPAVVTSEFTVSKDAMFLVCFQRYMSFQILIEMETKNTSSTSER